MKKDIENDLKNVENNIKKNNENNLKNIETILRKNIENDRLLYQKIRTTTKDEIKRYDEDVILKRPCKDHNAAPSPIAIE